MATPNLFAQLPSDPDYDPFEKIPGVDPSHLPKAQPSKGFSPGKRTTFDKMTGANPEVAGDDFAATTKRKTEPADASKRVMNWLKSQGYFAWKTEVWTTDFQGRMLKKDLFGFCDYIGIRQAGDRLELLGIQMTTVGGITPHVAKMASSATVKIPGGGEASYLSQVTGYLASGARLIILGWYQLSNGRWEWQEREVTMHDIEQAVARKRK